MADKSCCSCVFVEYKDNKKRNVSYIICTKNKEITDEMLFDSPCDEYIRVKLNMNQIIGRPHNKVEQHKQAVKEAKYTYNNKVASRDGSQSLARN